MFNKCRLQNNAWDFKKFFYAVYAERETNTIVQKDA